MSWCATGSARESEVRPRRPDSAMWEKLNQRTYHSSQILLVQTGDAATLHAINSGATVGLMFSDTGECARKCCASGRTDFARWKFNSKSANSILQAQVNCKIGRTALAKSVG